MKNSIMVENSCHIFFIILIEKMRQFLYFYSTNTENELVTDLNETSQF